MSDFTFAITRKDAQHPLMRSGVIHTPHGDIHTPAFTPVATKAAMKGMTVEMMKEVEAQALLANAYHLYIQPGHTLIKRSGGLGKFMNWDRPTFTDSGGFQVLSLGSGYKKVVSMVQNTGTLSEPSTRKAFVDEDGVNFKSHRDGSIHRFTPEVSMEIQHALGADICFAFDELTSLADEPSYHREALDRTHRWAQRSLDHFRRLQTDNPNAPYQALYGVLQGANIEKLRRETAQYLGAMDFDGFGIGGAIEKVHLGDIVRWACEELPETKPRHLLGISEPSDIFAAVESGIDTFDCVAPTREARNGAIYTRDGRYNLKTAKYRDDFTPLEHDCPCYVCRHYARAYVHHLFKSKEMLGATLASYHNEYFIISMVDSIRHAIESGTFIDHKRLVLSRYLSEKRN
ncbi:MAG: tRNA guanosine(34) transglycosylase Tgt [Candidatus Saccharimonadales bacterium]